MINRSRVLALFDFLITNGLVVDGAGNPWFRSDIGIKVGRVYKLGKLDRSESTRAIDAQGSIVCPGFIDIHQHSDHTILANTRSESYIRQGVTTEVIGNCGLSMFPIRDAYREELISYLKPFTSGIKLPWDWHSMGDFLGRLEGRGVGVNIVPLVGHGSVRIAVMGFEDRDPAEEEMADMKSLVEQAMEEGAFGLSSGLEYSPGVYSKTSEIIELCKVVARYGGFYATQMRSTIANLDEAIEISEKAELPVQIAHIGSSRGEIKELWGKQEEKTLKVIEKARERGLDITADLYPYTAGSSMLSQIIPFWVQKGGVEKMLKRLRNPEVRKRLKKEFEERGVEWDKRSVSYVKTDKDKKFEGKNLREIAETKGVHPIDALCDILIEERAEAMGVDFWGLEEDVRTLMKHYATMICSDGWTCASYGPLSVGKPHPRSYGTFPRVLGKYVRQEHTLTLKDAIRKMTSLPAQRLGLKGRGLIKEGFRADLVIFDPDKVIDKATFANPHRYPEGIDYVLVNGEIVIENGKHTGILAGQILRKQKL